MVPVTSWLIFISPLPISIIVAYLFYKKSNI
jgi:hypothetical protein